MEQKNRKGKKGRRKMNRKLAEIWRKFRYNYYMQLYLSCENAKQKKKLLKKVHIYKLS
ncbi:hypothetical protein HMPREF0083_05634 [Aneurinibacillus aneurinilyticus ATCC 12856]|uniref:Uncharacterized protein n=1 Tax=Aneurinibacillus aneurinilyticus ATCC 12856 TaxID=649747 RepID=U1XZY6_ANEAE|nr:hypothetical protein HMPREF0083_05634 [Aneurinibacillus aneurinilyticus ATCC 12856]